MGVKIEVLTAEDAADKFKKSYPANKLLGLVKRIDRLLRVIEAPVALRVHAVKKTGAPVMKGRKLEVQYFVDSEMAKIAKEF